MSGPTLREILGISKKEYERMQLPVDAPSLEECLANSVYGRRLLASLRRTETQKQRPLSLDKQKALGRPLQ